MPLLLEFGKKSGSNRTTNRFRNESASSVPPIRLARATLTKRNTSSVRSTKLLEVAGLWPITGCDRFDVREDTMNPTHLTTTGSTQDLPITQGRLLDFPDDPIVC